MGAFTRNHRLVVDKIHFENPDLLHLLWVLALQALMLFFYWRWRTRTLQKLGTPQLEARLLLGFSPARFWWKNAIFASVVALIVLAIAHPRRAERVTPPPKEGADILIALDVSRSMLAQDIAPQRLAQAKAFARQLIQSLENDRTGLLVFAGDAFPQSPLTNDPAALLMFVQNASPDAVNDQGTDFAAAMGLAERMFPSDSATGKALILISDGEDHGGEGVRAAEKARKSGIVVHCVSVGTAGGATIPGPTGGLLRDYEGNVVRTRSDEGALGAIARAGGGIALRIDEAGALTQLQKALQSLRTTAVEQQSYTAYVSYFQWLVLPALLLLILDQLLGWRRR